MLFNEIPFNPWPETASKWVSCFTTEITRQPLVTIFTPYRWEPFGHDVALRHRSTGQDRWRQCRNYPLLRTPRSHHATAENSPSASEKFNSPQTTLHIIPTIFSISIIKHFGELDSVVATVFIMRLIIINNRISRDIDHANSLDAPFYRSEMGNGESHAAMPAVIVCVAHKRQSCGR